MKIAIKEVKPGMRLEKAVMANDSDKCLLVADTTLTIKNIDKLKEYEIEWVEIADRNTVFITPNDKIAESLIRDFKSYLKKTSPSRPEANKNDKVIKRVFLQDYITTATFTVKSLKNAYNVVPDLRLPALELGLGVNLNWTPGLNLGVNIE